MKIQRNSGKIVFRKLRQILDTVSINCRKILRFGHPFGRLLWSLKRDSEYLA